MVAKVPLRGILAWFTAFMAVCGAAMVYGGAREALTTDQFVGIGLLVTGFVFLIGVAMVHARSPHSRRYWIGTLTAFWCLGAVGLSLPAEPVLRKGQYSTLAATALFIGYWLRSKRVHRTFGKGNSTTGAADAA